MPEKHLLLLPAENSGDWVAAVTEYAIKFGVNFTPDPNTAAKQADVVTVVIAPGAYAAQGGDIVAWFQKNHANLKLDQVRVSSPDELKKALAARIASGQRYGGQAPAAAAPPFLKWKHHALPGMHGPADPGGAWVPEAYDVIRSSKVRAVKMLCPDLQPEEVAQLRAIQADMFIMARLFNGQLSQPRGDGTPEGAGRWFANEVADPGDGNNPMNRAYNSGIRHFEVHNEVNLTVEGCGVNWKDGAEYARFFNTVVDSLKPRYPEALFGFPGLSPGPTFDIRPIEEYAFYRQAKAATDRADFICAHVYWGVVGAWADGVSLTRKVCETFPNKLIFISEFSNNKTETPSDVKADEYAQYYNACKALPSNLGGMFIYVLSWRDDAHNEGFLKLSQDESRWEPKGKAERLGRHPF
ncbi:MAG TPA: hypothetical protein VI793_17500 [Anaerolineales bacterium]|nr:hypothetical protein [Anaerolineales bacterium]